ncbi:AsnC family transcriptional regulator [Lutibacter sp.]|uniref:Lrp/AsnC family transcriptional regulator n=1 Tax=Lutibacter sp. TaxID=1925666 RepID=UPI0025C605F6|nr:AsnC family transcriptional regulator [Lutibacter sp.]MCF6181779.1 winged helix-turn-helix transcriptional regulator [Lutibacter sp.]
MKKYVLDEIDHQILDILIENARTPFTDIAKKLVVSAGTIHVRVKKMEDEGIIKGSTLSLDYEKMGYSFISHIGIYLGKTSKTKQVIKDLRKIPNVTIAYITAGKYNIFCKIRAKNTTHAKEIIFEIDDIDGVSRTETMISLEESINDKTRLMHSIFREL